MYFLFFLNADSPRFSCSSSRALKKSAKQEWTCPWTNYSCSFRGCIQKLFPLAEQMILPLGRCGHQHSHNISVQHIPEWSHLSTTPGYHCFPTFAALSLWIGSAGITVLARSLQISYLYTEISDLYTEITVHTDSVWKQSQFSFHTFSWI